MTSKKRQGRCWPGLRESQWEWTWFGSWREWDHRLLFPGRQSPRIEKRRPWHRGNKRRKWKSGQTGKHGMLLCFSESALRWGGSRKCKWGVWWGRVSRDSFGRRQEWAEWKERWFWSKLSLIRCRFGPCDPSDWRRISRGAWFLPRAQRMRKKPNLPEFKVPSRKNLILCCQYAAWHFLMVLRA